MSFRINTNISAMNSHMNSVNNNRGLDKSLSALSTGLRINKAADDASGLTIANQLRSQAQGLGQSIRNANDAINVMQTSDGALEEYTNIISTVRVKAIQAASDGQNSNSRVAIQNDIDKLLEEANNIATTTSFNGLKLLNGTFQNKEFHIGAYADETIGINIANTAISNIGLHVEETGNRVSTTALSGLTIKTNDLTAAVKVGDSVADTNPDLHFTVHSARSAWAKAVAINSVSNKTGVTATAKTEYIANQPVQAGTISAGSFAINGHSIGAINLKPNDSDNALVNALNDISDKTNVIASNDGGKILLTAKDGSGIFLHVEPGTQASKSGFSENPAGSQWWGRYGKITLISDLPVDLNDKADQIGFPLDVHLSSKHPLDSIDVTTRESAEKAIRTTDSALKQIDKIRSEIGSTQNQLESTIRNISVTQINVTVAESSIRDVDFASESASLSKHNILAKSGIYAISQSESAQQKVMTLLR